MVTRRASSSASSASLASATSSASSGSALLVGHVVVDTGGGQSSRSRTRARQRLLTVLLPSRWLVITLSIPVGSHTSRVMCPCSQGCASQSMVGHFGAHTHVAGDVGVLTHLFLMGHACIEAIPSFHHRVCGIFLTPRALWVAFLHRVCGMFFLTSRCVLRGVLALVRQDFIKRLTMEYS